MTAVTFSGLSSGLDTSSLVKQLVAAERAPLDVVASRQSDISSQKSIVSSLSSALAALGTAVRGMDQASELQPRVAASSDSHVTVAASSGAAATVHDVRVQQLSQARAKVGATQNRMTVTVSNLAVAQENLTAANSRIRDVDVAQESANLTKSQILSQAGLAVLAQANQLPQSALSLLR
jgi:flagellin